MKAKVNIEGIEIEFDGNQNELLETIKTLTKRTTKEVELPKEQKEYIDYLVSLDDDGYAKMPILPKSKGGYHRWKKKELKEIKKDLEEGKSISEICRKFGVTPQAISSQAYRKKLLPRNKGNEKVTYRKQNKEYRNKIKQALTLSKEKCISFQEAFKQIFPERKSVGGTDYEVVRGLGYKGCGVERREYNKYLTKRGKYVCSRTNQLMQTNPTFNREKAMSIASHEWAQHKNLLPQPRKLDKDEEPVTTTPPVVEEYPDNDKFKKAVTELINGRTGELPRIEGMNQELKPILIGIVRNAIREGNEMTFKELSYPLGINTLDEWNTFVESFIANAQKIANHYGVQNNFELMMRRGEKMIRYNKK